MGDDGTRRTRATNANELDEGVGRNAPRVWTQENRQLRPLPSPQPHFPHPSRALLRTSRRRRVRARELEDLERLYDLDVPHRLPGGLVARSRRRSASRARVARDHRACGGDEGAGAHATPARARGVEGVHLATIRASMGVGDARGGTNTAAQWARAVVQEKARAVVRGAHDDSLHPRLLELREARGCGGKWKPARRSSQGSAGACVSEGMRASDSDKKRRDFRAVGKGARADPLRRA